MLSGMTYKRSKFISGELKKKAALLQQAFVANSAANTKRMIQIALTRSRLSILISYST
jgi:hypothetical protein